MDRVTRCMHCGERMVPMPGLNGRTELNCVFCDDPEQFEADPPSAKVIR